MGEVWEWVGDGVTPGRLGTESERCIGFALAESFKTSAIVREEPNVGGVDIVYLLSAADTWGRAKVDEMAVCVGVNTVVLLRWLCAANAAAFIIAE